MTISKWDYVGRDMIGLNGLWGQPGMIRMNWLDHGPCNRFIPSTVANRRVIISSFAQRHIILLKFVWVLRNISLNLFPWKAFSFDLPRQQEDKRDSVNSSISGCILHRTIISCSIVVPQKLHHLRHQNSNPTQKQNQRMRIQTICH
jgi:hypothetical protein